MSKVADNDGGETWAQKKLKLKFKIMKNKISNYLKNCF
jgi:hypothetical protein